MFMTKLNLPAVFRTAIIITLLFLFPVAVITSQTFEEHPEFGKYFKERNIDGCFLLYDLKQNKYSGYNLKRTDSAFIPASTFKIFNSLVALETGVIKDENEIIKWDSVDRGYEQWNKDNNLRSAFKYSVVWFYQELARRIGQERMQKYIDTAGYGNQNINGGIDLFWLQGDLRITPKQQVDILVKLYNNDLPFSSRAIEIVKDIMIYEKTDDYILRAKTGWGVRLASQVGWFVGYVIKGDDVFFFVNNIDIHNDEDASGRISITKDILRESEIIK